MFACTYFIRARTDDHEVTSVTFSVHGAAAPEEGGEVPRDEDDGLLVPMPTLLPGFTSTPMPGEGLPAQAIPNRDCLFLLSGIVFGVGLLALFAFGLRSRR